MLCGAGKRLINPEEGHPAPRYGDPGDNEGVHSDLRVTALYLKDGEQEAYLLNYDLSGLKPDYIDRIRMEISKKRRVPMSHVVLTCTHTHSSLYLPGTIKPARKITDDDKDAIPQRYANNLIKWSAEAAEEAQSNAEECTLHYNYDYVKLNHNRRITLPDRTYYFTPKQKQFIGQSHEYIDHEVGIVAFKRKGAGYRFKAIITNYPTHPVCVGPTSYKVSADYPGHIRDTIEANMDGTLCLATTGAAGNLHPLMPEGGFRFAEKMGEQIADVAMGRLYDAVEVDYDTKLRLAYADVELPMRDEKTLALYPRKEDRKASLPEEAVLRTKFALLGIGPILFAGVPGEVVAEMGAMLKWSSRFLRTYVLYVSTDFIGYIPTANQYVWGGWESSRTRLAVGGGEKLVRAIQDKADELFDAQPIAYPVTGQPVTWRKKRAKK